MARARRRSSRRCSALARRSRARSMRSCSRSSLRLGLEPRKHCRVIRSGRTHRASRLLFVFAVPEAALSSRLGEVAEDLIDARAGIPQADLASARCVDDQPATGQLDQLPACGRVPALPSARTSAVASASVPESRFTSVDLPVPLGPTRTATRPSSRTSRRRPSPAPDALTATTSVPAATERAARRSASTSALRSDFGQRTPWVRLRSTTPSPGHVRCAGP